MSKTDFNNIVVRHNGRTISIAQQSLMDISFGDYSLDPIRFDGTVDGLINALQAIKMEVEL
tara:strand:+ start:184 stop:366 length:183 start_codon:yes stop_codon:yes gene_type:complete